MWWYAEALDYYMRITFLSKWTHFPNNIHSKKCVTDFTQLTERRIDIKIQILCDVDIKIDLVFPRSPNDFVSVMYFLILLLNRSSNFIDSFTNEFKIVLFSSFVGESFRNNGFCLEFVRLFQAFFEKYMISLS